MVEYAQRRLLASVCHHTIPTLPHTTTTPPPNKHAQAAYDRLLFREALKVAGYDLGNARDMYR